MPKQVVKSNTPMQSVMDIYTAAGAVYRLASRVDEFLCGGCGKHLSGGQVFGVMGPDNPFDPSFEGSPLCADCHDHEYGTPIDNIFHHFVPASEVANLLPPPTPKARRQPPKRLKTRGSYHTHSDPLTVRALASACQNLIAQGAGDLPVVVLTNSVLTPANLVDYGSNVDGQVALIVGHERA